MIVDSDAVLLAITTEDSDASAVNFWNINKGVLCGPQRSKNIYILQCRHKPRFCYGTMLGHQSVYHQLTNNRASLLHCKKGSFI